MTIFKLPIRNIKKSIKDYLIYFATLILGIALFYVFNAIEKQTAMLNLSNSGYDIMDIMFTVMDVVGVFVSFVLGFLIVYASNFLMKRRKKEFAVYMLLGMSKRSISTVIVMETVLIGIISLGVGLLLGIGASQGMSIIVANLFEADMTRFQFTISNEAVVKTLIYFLIMYVLVIIFDVFVVGKARLINLLNAGRHSEKNYAKNPILCLVVFAVAAVLLGTAYYKVTAGVETLDDFGDLATQVAKGIIGTFLAFWSVAGMLIFFAVRSKKFYHKGVNCFSVKELGSRINSNVFSGGIICLLLFFTITVLSCCFALRNGMNEVLRINAPADIMLEQTVAVSDMGDKASIIQLLEEKNVDMSKFSEYDEICLYDFHEVIADNLWDGSNDLGFMGSFSFDVVRVSDYNKIAKLYGRDELSVKEDEYILLANYFIDVREHNKALANGKTLDICGKTYKPKYDKCVELGLYMNNTEGETGIIIVPDSCDFDAYVDELLWVETLFIANYKELPKKELEAWDEYLAGDVFDEFINSDEHRPNVNVRTKSYLYASSTGLTAVAVFIGTYLGLVFLISAAAILSLKELSNAADNKGKYGVLRKIGVDEKMLNRSLMGQSLVFFGIPLLLAVLHSVFGIQTGMFILSAFSKRGLTGAIIASSGMMLVIYMVYFLITYYCSKEIIKE
ncbi:MAG: ABC transporter permease [Clostridium sp.]|nr:ABC transporter permease [Clostridium sp.]MCM1209818.1 ABC transporter permease [Ruminococcus sp.]